MAALCLDASLQMHRPLCCRRTLRLQEDLCRCFHKGSPEAVQAVVTLSTRHVLQNSPQFTVQGFEICTPRKPILGADSDQKVPPQPLLSCLGFWTGTESCWKTHYWPLKRVMLSCFTPAYITSSWYNLAPVSPLSCKNEDASTPDGTPRTKPWRRKGDGNPAPSECTSRDVWA
jgi:hypothetical protein